MVLPKFVFETFFSPQKTAIFVKISKSGDRYRSVF